MVEAISSSPFVPNDVKLGGQKQSAIVITGEDITLTPGSCLSSQQVRIWCGHFLLEIDIYSFTQGREILLCQVGVSCNYRTKMIY